MCVKLRQKVIERVCKKNNNPPHFSCSLEVQPLLINCFGIFLHNCNEHANTYMTHRFHHVTYNTASVAALFFFTNRKVSNTINMYFLSLLAMF